MNDVEQLQAIMKELGPVLQPELISQHSDTQWSILLDEDTLIDLEYEPLRKQLSFYSTLGAPDEEQLLSTLQACLVYNFLSKDTGGVVLALDAPDGELVQIYHLALDDHYDLPLLCSVITNFGEKAAIWRDLLASGGIDLNGDQLADAKVLLLDPNTAIKV